MRSWPTAYPLRRDHRTRVQISSGAFPRYNHNPDPNEPRETATIPRVADQKVFHDPAAPPMVILPVRQPE
ncbi:hypothetical protein FRAHR75_1760001 [Frankia sp. Hr75.2]|nr:hypothetical protein FRAHR75_1760001 [Frankia sp. Hr75.2]